MTDVWPRRVAIEVSSGWRARRRVAIGHVGPKGPTFGHMSTPFTCGHGHTLATGWPHVIWGEVES
jgi:hypothetical protein